MKPTFLGFQTAARAMAASQASLEVTGNNIANANTVGYTRQRVDLNSISASGFTQKYAVAGASTGLGVEVGGISQIRDPFLDLRYRSENAESGKLDTILTGLSSLENIFDETENPGLQSELSNFTNQLQTLSQSPTSKDLQMIVRTAAQKLTQVMNIYSQQTDQVRDQQIYGLSNIVVNNDFNAIVKNIASMNKQIREDQTYGDPSNELKDQRNVLMDNLSRIANIKVSVTPDRISEDLTVDRVSISLYDPDTSTSILLLENDRYNTLSVDSSKEDVRITISRSIADQQHPSNDVTEHFSGGVIKGYLDVINGKGNYADLTKNENAFRGTLYYKSTMDTFAANFASALNTINATEDTTTNPTTTVPKPLFSSSDGAATPITAGNIRIASAWLDNPSYITTTKDTPPRGGSDNVLKMIQAMSEKHAFTKAPKNPADPPVPVFEGSYNQYMTGLVSELALDKNLNQNFANTSHSVLNGIFDSRESISGVSMDEEGINLMAYQKSYNAAARFLTTLDEAVDTLINRMGIVGR